MLTWLDGTSIMESVMLRSGGLPSFDSLLHSELFILV